MVLFLSLPVPLPPGGVGVLFAPIIVGEGGEIVVMDKGEEVAATWTGVKGVLCSASRRSERCTVYRGSTKLLEVRWPNEEPMGASFKSNEVGGPIEPARSARTAMEVRSEDVKGERKGRGGR